MKIAIIGGSSVIGCAIAENFKSKYSVITVGRKNTDTIQYDFKNIEGISDESIGEHQQIDIIINCIGSFKGDEHAMDNLIINTASAIVIANFAKKVKCRQLININSLFTMEHKDNGYYNSYAISKKHASEYLEYLCSSYGITYTDLITTQIYDEDCRCVNNQPFFYKIIENARLDKEICLYGNSSYKRNYLFLEDLVRMVDNIIKNNVVGKCICLGKRSYTIQEISQIAIEVFNSKSIIRIDREKDLIKKVYIPSNDILEDTINYFGKTDLRTGIQFIKENIERSNQDV